LKLKEKHLEHDIFVGVDGGATKSKVRIEDSAGNLLGQAVGGPANIRLSVDTAWQSIYNTVEEALQPHNISLQDTRYRFHAGMGLAGCEVQDAYHDYLNRPHPFSTILLTSDARIACVGAHHAQDGAIITVGTGVVGYQLLHGQGLSVGGWGFPHDDEGGGAWLGLEAARLTFQWLDHRIEKAPLVEDVFSFFDNDTAKFVSWANSATSHEFARLAPLVINHSQQEEPLALRLMKKAAQAVNRIAVALEKNHHSKEPQESPLRCCLFGGIAPFLEPWLGEELRSRLVPRQGDANTGAILMIRQLMERK
jgi:glucosamine kinase